MEHGLQVSSWASRGAKVLRGPVSSCPVDPYWSCPCFCWNTMKYQSLLGLSSCLTFLVASRSFFGPGDLCSPCIYHVFAHVFIVYIYSIFHFLDFVALCVFVKISGPKLEGLTLKIRTYSHCEPIVSPLVSHFWPMPKRQVSLCRCSGRHQGRNRRWSLVGSYWETQGSENPGAGHGPVALPEAFGGNRRLQRLAAPAADPSVGLRVDRNPCNLQCILLLVFKNIVFYRVSGPSAA